MRTFLPTLTLSFVWGSTALTAPDANLLHRKVLLLVEASARETYDNNIYSYDYGKMGRQESWISQGLVKLGLKLDLGGAGTWIPSYTWEGQEYHQATEESHQRHGGRLEFSGKSGDWSWQGDLQQQFTDGSTTSPTWTGRGGAPAVGAPEVRNRRRNFTLDQTLQATWRPGDFWFRGSYRGQLHDFMTTYSAAPGYQNYDDRSDFSLGWDAGHTLRPGWDGFVGLRLGTVDQGTMPGTPVEYDNQYLRIVGGMQGRPVPWLMVDGEVGPDFRDFTAVLPEGEMDRRTEIYYRATAVISFTARDHLQMAGKQYLFPSSAGCGMMREGIWDAEYRHQFTLPGADKPWLTGAAGLKVHEDDFFPADRRDRVFTPRMEWKTSWDHPVQLRALYEYTWSESGVDDTPAREFTRQRFTLSATWIF